MDGLKVVFMSPVHFQKLSQRALKLFCHFKTQHLIFSFIYEWLRKKIIHRIHSDNIRSDKQYLFYLRHVSYAQKTVLLNKSHFTTNPQDVKSNGYTTIDKPFFYTVDCIEVIWTLQPISCLYSLICSVHHWPTHSWCHCPKAYLRHTKTFKKITPTHIQTLWRQRIGTTVNNS